jgi:hypothetical protein
MRRISLGLLIALLTFGAGAQFVWKTTPAPVVPNSGVVSYTSSDYDQMAWYWETHPSPLKATEEFNAHLQRATQYMEFTSCFDRDGRRIGERAVMYLTPPHSPQPIWQITWTQRTENFSESFTVESPLLSEARHGETVGQADWKKCISTK